MYAPRVASQTLMPVSAAGSCYAISAKFAACSTTGEIKAVRPIDSMLKMEVSHKSLLEECGFPMRDHPAAPICELPHDPKLNFGRKLCNIVSKNIKHYFW